MTPFSSRVSLPGCSAEHGGQPAFVCCYKGQALPLMRVSGCRDVLVIQVSHLEHLSWYNIISSTQLPSVFVFIWHWCVSLPVHVRQRLFSSACVCMGFYECQ